MHNIYRGIALKGGPGQIADLRRGRVFLRGVDTPIQTMIYLYVYYFYMSFYLKMMSQNINQIN